MAQGLLHSVVADAGLQVLDDAVRVALFWCVVQMRECVEERLGLCSIQPIKFMKEKLLR